MQAFGVLRFLGIQCHLVVCSRCTHARKQIYHIDFASFCCCCFAFLCSFRHILVVLCLCVVILYVLVVVLCFFVSSLCLFEGICVSFLVVMLLFILGLCPFVAAFVSLQLLCISSQLFCVSLKFICVFLVILYPFIVILCIFNIVLLLSGLIFGLFLVDTLGPLTCAQSAHQEFIQALNANCDDDLSHEHFAVH